MSARPTRASRTARDARTDRADRGEVASTAAVDEPRRAPAVAAAERRGRARAPRSRRGWLSSIVVMLAASFLLVALPLMGAIGVGMANFNRLAEESAQALDESTFLASRSEEIAADVRELARHTLQAAELGPGEEGFPSLVKAFAGRQEQLAGRIRELLYEVDDDAYAQAQLEALLARSAALVNNFSANPRDPAQGALIGEMRDLAEWWTDYAQQRSRERSTRVREVAEQTQRTLSRLVVAIPTALVLIVVLTWLISHSLRQISRAIGQLGENRFDDPIRVKGPADLRALGEDLDALRMRLRQAELQKQRFLRHMSHELKTPLASLLEGTELFVDGSLGVLPTAQSEVAGILRSNAQELRHLIENLLDYSAWQSSHGSTLRCTEFDLQVLCEQVLDQYRLMMRTRRVRVDQRIVPVRLHADRDKMRTVLSNLVSNAIKYTPEQGTIFVRAYRAGRHLMFDLADTGPNIAPAERHHVFEPFFTGTPPQQAHLKGSGIGLSLVREYVRAHGGDVELVDGVYRGAHFRIRMPVQAESGPVRLSA